MMFSSKLIGNNFNSLSLAAKFLRNASTKPTTNGEILPQVFNRNPRNLERLRIGFRPTGYCAENKEVEYWHKLEVNNKGKYVTARLIHYSQKLVVQASTSEWGLEKNLYSGSDKQAFIVLAQVFAERCLESGITCFYCNIENVQKDSKMDLFLKTLKNEGITLEEPPLFRPEIRWHRTREKKPWTVLED